jgi:hypothetical protein
MTSSVNEELAARLKILDTLRLDEGIDYATIGRILVAEALRKTHHEIASKKPDADGHVFLRTGGRVVLGLHPGRPRGEEPILCCLCWALDDGSFACHGSCCVGGPDGGPG